VHREDHDLRRVREVRAIAALLATLAVTAGDGGIVDARELTVASPRGSVAPVGWQASWDRATGVPAWLWGGRADALGSVADPAVAEREARAFIATHVHMLAPGAVLADFVPLANHLDRGTRTVTFAQTWRGLRVHGGSIGVVFGRDRIVAVRSRAYPDIAATFPRTSSRHRVVLPIVETSGVRYRVADVIDTRAPRGPERWDVFVDSITGVELKRTSKVLFGTGTLEYGAGVRYGAGARTTYPAASASIIADSTSTLTSPTGAFSWTGTAPTTVLPSLVGTFVRVTTVLGPSLATSLDVTDGGTAIWDAPGSETADAQISTFVYGNIAKARSRVINPAITTWLDGQFDFFVNDAGGCNAYATADEVHMFVGNAACENTGRISDIVFHEFGHTLHYRSVIDGIGDVDGHLSEGLADFFASNITNDSGMGRGFFRNDQPLREIDPPGFERVYPQDFDFDTHVSGLIIAGALWDLRQRLITELGTAAGIARTEQIFTGIMQRADDISTTFTAALIADDDDAELGNGTPNFCAIETTFGRHGLVPSHVMTRVEPPVISGRSLALRVTTPTGTPCPPLAVSSVRATWAANDGVATELALVPAGDLYTGAFPEQPDGTLITFSVDVTFADGSSTSFPQNAADPRYQLYLGDSVPLWCERFDADPEWEETSNIGAEWEWGAPRADATSPDPDAPFAGAGVLGTDLTSDGAYRANLSTSIVTPVISVPAYQTVRLQYRRWLTVEDGTYDVASIEANGTEVWRNTKAQNGTLDHVDREWRYHDLDITPWITDGTLQLNWKLASDFAKELGGWTLDDVCVVGITKLPACGDGVVDLSEQCDDGNRASDDGCAATCTDEITAGGGGCSTSSGRNGWVVLLLALAYLRRRASSFIPSRSVSARVP
jgi:cysteine-rich repeat protein